ncbi:MAG: hypothetical protein MJZ13_01965 [Bacteroidales bacterium]|nr:hypothetical protein [Bacteroidales bacterium]
MRNLLISLLALCSMPLGAFAQWTSHLSLKSCSFVAMTGRGPVAGNSSGFFIYDTSEGYLHSFTKANHLSDIGITALFADGNNVYVGYKNGNIDVVNVLDYTTINIPEYKNYKVIEDKTINGFYRMGTSLYCSTNGGVLHVDLRKHEIKSRYQIDFQSLPKVNALAAFNDSLYAATNVGLYRAYAKSSLLENNEEWKLCSDSTANVSSIAVFNDSIVVSIGSVSSENIICAYSNGVFCPHLSVPKFRSMTTSSDAKSLVVASSSMVSLYDESFNVLNSFGSYSLGQSVRTAYAMSAIKIGESLYIADSGSGLVKVNSSSSVCYSPDGPSNNYVYRIIATKNGVFCTGGGVNRDYNNLNRNIYIHSYVGGKWATVAGGARDPLNIVYDRNCVDSIYFSTWGTGIYKYDAINKKLGFHYTAANSPLQDIFGGSNYTRSGAIAYDDKSNLYVAQAEVAPGIVVKNPANEWYELSYPISDDLHSSHKMIFTSNGNGWVSTLTSNRCGVFVFNTNGTLEDDSDDMFRGAVSDSSDPRDKGQLLVSDAYGERITENVYDIVEDHNGILWLATDQGILTFADDKTVFSNPTPVFSHIKVPRNDGTNSADYLLDGVSVSSIAVDGANRKWIGTSSNGVYLLSADGLETIHAFNVDNSPLISNEINSIAVHPATGEVFFATPLGIMSYAGDATEPEEALTDIKVWPNPVKSSFTGDVKMFGFSEGCSVRITDMEGRIVYATTSIGGLAKWNCKNLDGHRVSTGVYLIWAIDTEGTEKLVSKIMVIK